MAWAPDIYPDAKMIKSIDELDFINLRSIQAHLSASLLFGQGATPQSDNKEIQKYLNNFWQNNKMNDRLYQLAYDTAFWGGVICTIDRSENGMLWLSHATPEILQIVSKIDITPFRAEIMKKRVVGAQIFYIREIWTDRYVERNLTIQSQGVIRPINEKDEIPAELRIPAYEEHNLGFVPIEEFTNKPAINTIASGIGSYYERVRDGYNVRHLELQVNNLYRQHYKETIFGKSKVFGNIRKSELTAMMKNQYLDAKMMLSDFIIETGKTEGQSKPIETMPATYDGAKWLEPVEMLINQYWFGCLYSDPFPKQAEMTEAESIINKDRDMRTTNDKRYRWGEFLNNLFAKLIVYEGFAEDLDEAREMFTIEIKENVVYNRLQLTQFLIQNVQARFMSRLEAIMMQRNIENKEKAQEILDSIDKEFESEQEMMQKVLGDPQSENNAENEHMGSLGANEDQEGYIEEIAGGK